MSPEPIRDLGFARVDLQREMRCGRPEVIFCPGKLPSEVAEISATLIESGQRVLVTRASADHYAAVSARLPQAVFHHRAGCIVVGTPLVEAQPWKVGLLCAGTADLPVAEE